MAQLQEAQRLNRDACVAAEQQAQELARAQRTLRAQSEELRLAQESNEKSAEASNALLASWRDKFQASAKAAAAAEATVQELEAKVRVQGEEIMKQTFVMQTKAQEMERFKEHEAARSRAEAAAQAAALAEAEAEAKRVKAKALEEKRRIKVSAEDSNRGLRGMEEKVHALESALHNAETATKDLEKENAELSQRMRDMQVRDSEGDESELDEEFDEVERDELELNNALQHVVATVFPTLAPVESDTSLDENIAQYEDSTRSPLKDIYPGPVNPGTVVSTGNMVSRSELNALRVLSSSANATDWKLRGYYD
ncbi:hypothetical protein JM18_000989 [Phytophthora kernoviae]|uniref:Uncharacterized protein n=1 Tax=Phytophthora kernoviae TaxID=325452 RepID=A0A8T0M5W5_9STRA|nr:hypothetical protein JM16_001743 [Phytophthora kernoviae]KAG2531712.1 hypothetical protein JM18_000989 [Phytophthora kernoviae]